MTEVILFWFRRDLRIDDNTGLYYALNEGIPVLPIFIFDSQILDNLDDKTDARVSFIHDQITSLHARFQSYGSGLKVYYGNPIHIFKKLSEEFQIKSVFTNRDYEPYATQRDQAVESLLSEKGIGFYTFKDQVIFEKGEILNEQGEPYKVFTPYKNKWIDRLSKLKFALLPVENHLSALLKYPQQPILTLKEIGFARTSIPLPPSDYQKIVISNYSENRNFPGIKGTTRLGIHLRFGTISLRRLILESGNLSEVWLSELIWREFYMMILAHFPYVIDRAFKPIYDRIEWRKNEVDFEHWCEGKTGYPIVDAGMRELNATGFMHNRVRMVVASFLTKHLLIDWRWGEHYFATKLLDFELASNNGGWQWAAGTGTDAQPYFRVFNPISQQEKFDKDFSYIKKWVPEYLSSTYPKPIVEHKLARERAIKTYKEAVS